VEVAGGGGCVIVAVAAGIADEFCIDVLVDTGV